MNNITENLAVAAIADNLQINPNDWVLSSRSMYFPNMGISPFTPDKLPIVRNEEGLEGRANDDRLDVLIGSQNDLDTEDIGGGGILVKMDRVIPTTIQIKEGNSIKRVRYADMRTMRAVMFDGSRVFLHIVNGQYEEMFRISWPVISANSTYLEKVKTSYRNRFGVPEGAEIEAAQLIRFMATSYCTFVNQPVVYDESRVAIEVGHAKVASGQVMIDLTTTLDGNRREVNRYFTQLYPSRPALGTSNTAQNRGSGAAFSMRENFIIATDLNIRKSGNLLVEHVDNPKDLKVKSFSSFRDPEGNDVHCTSGEVIVDLSADLPTYDYFGLVEGQ